MHDISCNIVQKALDASMDLHHVELNTFSFVSAPSLSMFIAGFFSLTLLLDTVLVRQEAGKNLQLL